MNPLAQQTRLYLDTSVLSFLLADDAPEKQVITQAFFESVDGLRRVDPGNAGGGDPV